MGCNVSVPVKNIREMKWFAPREEKKLSKELLSKEKQSTRGSLFPMVLLSFYPAPSVLWPLACVQISTLWAGVGGPQDSQDSQDSTPRHDISGGLLRLPLIRKHTGQTTGFPSTGPQRSSTRCRKVRYPSRLKFSSHRQLWRVQNFLHFSVIQLNRSVATDTAA